MSTLSLPVFLALYYLCISIVCFIAYARDKAAARRRARRTPERSLLLLGLAGGWPGGLLAQQWLRHKTVKLPFRHWFWLTVVLNLAACTSLALLARHGIAESLS